MHKREALKLKRGDIIAYGDSMWTRDCDGRWQTGTVEMVTPKGGIKLQSGSWVPYHHVLMRLEDEEDRRGFIIDVYGFIRG